MKCIILSSEKLRSPIVECGFVVLGKDTKLVVKAEIANRIIRQYGPVFKSEECERENLRNGHYQIEGSMVQAPMPVAKESPLQQVASDRSMASVGKTKTRRKGK